MLVIIYSKLLILAVRQKDTKSYRPPLIAVGLSSPLSKSKSSFISFILGVFRTPKSSIGLNRESGSLSVYFYIPAASNLSRT